MNVAELILQHADTAPDDVAFFDTDARAEVTWSEVRALALRYAAGITNLGIGRGDRIVLMLEPSVDTLALVIGTVACGAVAVVVEPDIRPRTVLRAIELSGADHAVVGAMFGFFHWLVPKAWNVELFVEGGSWPHSRSTSELRADTGAGFALDDVGPHDPAWAAFLPDGTLRTDDHALLAARHRVTLDAWGHGAGHVSWGESMIAILAELARGSTVVLPPRGLNRRDGAGRRIVDLWKLHSVTRVIGGSALFREVVEYLESRDRSVDGIEHVVAETAIDRALEHRMVEAFPNARRWSLRPCEVGETGAVEPSGGPEVSRDDALGAG